MDGIMDKAQNLLTRDEFRSKCLSRDQYKCVVCESTFNIVVHHVIERRLWPDGGYYMENGVSVCETHHLECEMTIISVEDIRHHAGITKIVVPPQFYDDHVYDKWGNPVLEGGRRGRGPLFHDESVQKILQKGGVLELFTPYVKYPRTMHCPWSPGVHDDDKVIESLEDFIGKRVIVTKKMDGENTTFYQDHIHARSIDSRGGEDRAWVKQFWSTIAHDIPEGWRICGENLWAEHSIHYSDLKSYFYGFSIWNEVNHCLSWDEMLQYFELFGIVNVPVLYDGIYDEKAIRKLGDSLDFTKDEGYVIRVAEGFSYGEFHKKVMKFVRKGHIQTTKHWRQGRSFIPNEVVK